MVEWRTDFYEARWHLGVAKRMIESYDEYGGKRFLIGVIRETAKAARNSIRMFLIFDETRGNLQTFTKKVGPKYLDAIAMNNLIRILEVERAQRRARVELFKAPKDASSAQVASVNRNKEGSIVLEVDGKWRILEISRLRELVNTVDNIVSNFPTDIKR